MNKGVGIGAAVAALAAAVMLPVLLVGGTAGADCGSANLPDLPKADAAAGKGDLPKPWGAAKRVRNTAMIVATGQNLKVPPRGWVVAVATAMQESTVLNLASRAVPESLDYPHDGVDAGDHTSVGVFQQLNSWGSVARRMDPREAAEMFYRTLLKVDGWQQMSVAEAAQAVQRSAFPDEYAKHEQVAKQLVEHVLDIPDLAAVGGGGPEAPCGLGALGDVPISAKGWVKPMNATVGSGFREPGRPTHDGVDMFNKRGTPIRAAAAGKVIWADCDPGTGNCDVDGSMNTPGCGWYVDIRHQGGIVTRYCHMVKRPVVSKGQVVQAGQPIGFEGTSGNSSGEHLHFEVHLNVSPGGYAGSENAVNPVTFMQRVGAPLGMDKKA